MNLPLKYSTVTSQIDQSVVMEVTSPETENLEPSAKGEHSTQKARGIIDLSGTKLNDRPSFLEEKLLKTRGVFSAEINAFSNHMTVEFDPSLISLAKIKAMIGGTDNR